MRERKRPPLITTVDRRVYEELLKQASVTGLPLGRIVDACVRRAFGMDELTLLPPPQFKAEVKS